MIKDQEFFYFRHPSEVDGRSEYSPDAVIDADNFVRIIGGTKFAADDKVQCQVSAKHRKGRCKSEHWNGFVALNANGEIGYMGSTCGKRYLSSNEAFEREMRHAERMTRLHESAEALRLLLEDGDKIRRRAERVRDSIGNLRYHAIRTRDSMPKPTRSYLKDVLKGGQGQQVGVQYLTIRKAKNKNDDDEYDWRTEIVGSIQGVSTIDIRPITKVVSDAENILQCLHEARADVDAGQKDLRRWSEAIGGIDELEGRADAIQSAHDAFHESANLRLLLLTSRSGPLRDDIAEFILNREGQRMISKSDCQCMVRDYDAALSSARDHQGFRILVR